MDEIEIPEAIRENAELPQKSRLALSLPLIIGAILCLGLLGISLMFLFFPKEKPVQIVEDEPISQPAIPQSKAKPIQPKQKQNPIKTNTPSKTQVPATTPSKGDLLGHLPYKVASPGELTPIANTDNILMRPSAAQKFKQMQTAAQAEGVNLVPISAFRTLEAQEQLFFGVKEQRVQDAAKRAEVSAPPGYSEHHTGYAVDIGDGNAPATHVEPEFEQTAVFKWLKQNALKYSFELSFPPDNEQGVSYEPWHWRFVGDRDSLETFYKVRN